MCADDLGVGDFLLAVCGDVFVSYGEEGVCAGDALSGSIWVGTYALAEAAHLVGDGAIEDFAVFWVTAELAIFVAFAALYVEDS